MPEDMQYLPEQASGPLANQTLTPKEQIEVILHEYVVLRDEVLAFHTQLQSIFALSFTIVGGAVGFIYQTRSFQLFVLMPAAILIFVNVEARREFTIFYLTMYLSLLEQKVNKLAGEPLLLWQCFAGSHRTLAGRFRIKHPTENRYVTNLDSIIMLVSAVAGMLLFFYSLLEGGKWLFATLQIGSQVYKVIVLILYEFGHLFFMGLILFNRFVQQEKLLSLVEHKLRERIFRD